MAPVNSFPVGALSKPGKDAGSVACYARERPRPPDGAAQRAYRALVTLPALRQRVHTYTRLGARSTRIRTFCRFGSKRRLVATIEWLRLCPNAGPFPQL